MNPADLLPLLVWGILVGVDLVSLPQMMIARPIVAGTVAGAISMAAGEYVSVQSQADTEQADMRIEQRELHEEPEAELEELAGIYRLRGLDPGLARQVAEQLTAHDALGAHARDELGINDSLRARPLQAALASAAAFTVGAALPVAATLLAPQPHTAGVVTTSTMVLMAFTLGSMLRRTMLYTTTGRVDDPDPATNDVMT